MIGTKTANISQDVWIDTNGRVVAIEYWNGTALVQKRFIAMLLPLLILLSFFGTQKLMEEN